MEIIDKFKSENTTSKLQATRIFEDDQPAEIELNIATEHHMLVVINTVPTFEVVCSPDHLSELVVGRLLSEGIVASVGEISQVYICDEGKRAEVLLKDSKRGDFNKTSIDQVSTCCTGNKTLNSYYKPHDVLQPVTPICWTKEWLFNMTKFFRKDSPAHKKSFGTHSCYVSWDTSDFSMDKPFVCEDLGRHNAFDKAIGCAVCAGIDLKRCMAFTSGRLPVDMVSKAVRAKIPILASKAVPTESGIELARQSKLTLICSAYPDSADVILDFS